MKMLFVYLVAFVLLISFVSASIEDNLIGCYPLEESSGTNAENLVEGGVNGTYVNTPTLGQTCKVGDCPFLTDDNTEYVDLGALMNASLSNGNFTLSLWYYGSASTQGYVYIIAKGDSTARYHGLFHRASDNKNDNNWANSGGSGAISDTQPEENWYHLVMHNKEDGGLTMYINTVAEGSHSTAGDYDSEYLYIGASAYDYTSPSQPFDGYVDEVKIWDRLIEFSEIEEDYNSGNGLNCTYLTEAETPPEDPIPTLLINTNLTDTINYNQDSFSISYNGTISNYNGLFNCSLYNVSEVADSIQETNLTINQEFLLNLSGTGNYTLNINCSGTNITNITNTFTLAYDLVIPSLVIASDINNTNYYDDTTFGNNVTYTDLNLFEIGHYIKDLDNTTTYEYFNISELSVTTYMHNISNSTADLGVGNFMGFAWAYDSHTGEELLYDIIIIDDYSMMYNNILIYSDKKLKFDKEKDKYSFIVDKKSELCYHTDNYWTKIQDTSYNSHYIDFENMIWVDELEYDFEERYTDGKLQDLCFYNDKDKEYKTKSIGDLNYNEIYYYFNITEAPTLDELYYPSFNESLTSINSTLGDIEEVLNVLSRIPIIIIPLVFGFFCILGAISLGQVHSVLKTGLFLLFPVSIMSAGYLGSVALNGTITELTDALANQIYWMGWIFAVIIFYFLIYGFYIMTRKSAQEKKDKLEY